MSTPSFSELYQALYDRGPFPWQVRLAEIVLTDGWPSLLDLPTGAGKTSALDIALYCLARAPQNMPRRTLLVVDRRIVVDQGAQHARRLLQKLWTAEDGPAKWAACRAITTGRNDRTSQCSACRRSTKSDLACCFADTVSRACRHRFTPDCSATTCSCCSTRSTWQCRSRRRSRRFDSGTEPQMRSSRRDFE
jgi:CRISPR-associated helicase Cas3